MATVQNPTSHIQNGKICPSLNTRYFIDGKQIFEAWSKLCEKRDAFYLKKKSATTHTLDSFNEANTNCSNSQNQKEKKSKLVNFNEWLD